MILKNRHNYLHALEGEHSPRFTLVSRVVLKRQLHGEGLGRQGDRRGGLEPGSAHRSTLIIDDHFVQGPLFLLFFLCLSLVILHIHKLPAWISFPNLKFGFYASETGDDRER